ncbi:MAG: hypothetical protein U5K27_16870 [Desulfotignum sp.]|nr:hypothetical protein [Desulfotignum sp.]
MMEILMIYIFDSEAFSTIISLQCLIYNIFQGFGVVRGDDLTGKSFIDQVRDPADVIDVGMGDETDVVSGSSGRLVRVKESAVINACSWAMPSVFWNQDRSLMHAADRGPADNMVSGGRSQSLTQAHRRLASHDW